MLTVLTGLVFPLVLGWDRRRKERKVAAEEELEKVKREKALKRVRDGFHALYKAYRELDRAIKLIGGHRAMILCAHNGGGVPGPTKQAKVTILYETDAPGVREVREDFIGRPLDLQYAGLISNLLNKEVLHLVTEDLDDGFLKIHYSADGVKASYVALVGTSDNGVFYLSVNFSDCDKPFTPKRMARLAAIHSSIANIYSQFPEVFEEAV